MNTRVVDIDDEAFLAPLPLASEFDSRVNSPDNFSGIDDALWSVEDLETPSGLWSINVQELTSVATASTPVWGIGSAPLWIEGEGSEVVAAHVVRHFVGMHHCGELHVHVLAHGPLLTPYAELPHAGVWCADGDLAKVRRALAVLAVDLERRSGAHGDLSQMGRRGDGLASLLPLQLIVIDDLGRWLQAFNDANDHVSAERLTHLVRRGDAGGYGMIVVTPDDVAIGASSSLGLLLVDALKAQTAVHMVRRERAVLAAGRINYAPNPLGGGKRPYRLTELPRQVPLVALSAPTLGTHGMVLPIGLDVDRAVASLPWTPANRVVVADGEPSGRAALRAVVQAGAQRVGVRVLDAADLFGPSDNDASGQPTLVIADRSSIDADRLRLVLNWSEIARQHYVLQMMDSLDHDAASAVAGRVRVELRDGHAVVRSGAGGVDVRLASIPRR